MLQEMSINLWKFLLSLSDAIDLASPLISSHQIRTAYISWQMARAAGLPEERVERVFVAALLHDIGALAPEDKVRLHRFETTDTETHCIFGERLFSMTPLLRPAARIVRHHHTRWSDWNASLDDPDVLEAQLIYLGDLIERYVDRDRYILHQPDDIISKITEVAGTEIHPDVVDMFVSLSKREDVWLDLASPRLYSLLLNFGPFRRIEIDVSDIYTLSQLFRSIIDFRSAYTATHSTGVASCAAVLSRLFGLTDTEVTLMEVAGNLHDLGKLAIPNSILNKPGKLTDDEFAVMKQHTYYTYSILNSIGGMEYIFITEWAAFHHEKLDGSGYPFHISGEKISTGARIMTVADIFTALAEDRPYRKGMPRKEVEEILTWQAGHGKLDSALVGLLKSNYGDILAETRDMQARSLQNYEKHWAKQENTPGIIGESASQ
ncbi:MAG: HD domain-containing protein [Deltaproteobacteria bacterium]|nr:HD domain-containing protein [Deltaproteobacteria bacterium]